MRYDNEILQKCAYPRFRRIRYIDMEKTVLQKEEANPFGLRRVARGETLSAICEECGVPELCVIRKNRLTGEPQEGQILLLPQGDYEVYIVRAGDTPASVSRAYGMTEEEFFSLNGVRYLYPTLKVWVKAAPR